MTHEEYQRAFDMIEDFNRRIAIWEGKLDAAWEGKRLREYLWLRQGEIRSRVLLDHFEVGYPQMARVIAWLRRWGWRVYYDRHTRVYKFYQPTDYQDVPPIGKVSPGKRKPPKKRKNKKWRTPSDVRLSPDEITSLQAQGYSLGQIARAYNLHPSTPCQILRRARIKEQAAQD